MRRKPLTPEERLQFDCAEYLKWVGTGKRWRWFHIPNGGKMPRYRGGKLKAMGVKAGAPDLMIQCNGGTCIEIELKTDKGRQSPAQKEWQEESIRLGIPYYICRSLMDLERILKREGLA